jgi:hypothetical protein
MRTVSFFEDNAFGIEWKHVDNASWEEDENGCPVIPPIPDGVRFVLSDDVERIDHRLVFRGWLENPTDDVVPIALVDVSQSGSVPAPLAVKFAPEQGVEPAPQEGPRPPVAFPEPFIAQLPPGTRVEFLKSFDLGDWVFETGRTYVLVWGFAYYWVENPAGTVKADL